RGPGWPDPAPHLGADGRAVPARNRGHLLPRAVATEYVRRVLLARVALPIPLGQVFTYQVGEQLAPGVRRGARVLCELGRRKVLGVVLDASDREPDIPVDRLKPVLGVVDAEPVLPEELLGFLQELGRYYVAPLGEVMELALPAVERSAALALEAPEATRAVGRLVQIARAVDGVPAPSLRGKAPATFEHRPANGPEAL